MRPPDPRKWSEERRYHAFLLVTGLIFTTWIAIVVVGHFLGTHEQVGDDVQLITVALAVLALFVGQHQLHKQSRRIYEHVNSVEEHTDLDGDDDDSEPQPRSLGGLVRQTRDEMREGFKRNDETHNKIIDTVKQQDLRIHDVHGQAESNRIAIEAVNDRVSAIHRDPSPEPNKGEHS